ncbi:MAG: hypothetical protein MUO72_09600 [Bacteroidales bacterium]|nr:hypothetical protein [Bacteroidales bacterium]
MNEVTIIGKINEDCKVKAVFTPVYEQFLKENKGSNISMTITVIGSKGTILQETYYRKVVLPCLQKGFKITGDDITLQETHNQIRSMCPETCCISEEEELSKHQLAELIDYSIRICAANFGIIVPEPNKD